MIDQPWIEVMAEQAVAFVPPYAGFTLFLLTWYLFWN
jgi:hypothetical protein